MSFVRVELYIEYYFFKPVLVEVYGQIFSHYHTKSKLKLIKLLDTDLKECHVFFPLMLVPSLYLKDCFSDPFSQLPMYKAAHCFICQTCRAVRMHV